VKVLKVMSLPDELRDWQGTAAELAVELNKILLRPDVGLEADAGSANERLIRYYVAEGVLSEPAPRGRERLFGITQIAQFLTARLLLKDGWRLAKVAQLIHSSSNIDGLLQLGSAAREPTAAEQTLARLRRPSSPEPAEASSWNALSQQEPRALSSSAPPSTHATDSPLPVALERAADLTQRRTKLQADLKNLGNRFGQPERQRVVSIALTPWCQVLIDARQLTAMDSITPRVLGDALASALEEERLNLGETK
jgi:DNA-binding transcriptional MerR regulator